MPPGMRLAGLGTLTLFAGGVMTYIQYSSKIEEEWLNKMEKKFEQNAMHKTKPPGPPKIKN